MGLVSLIEAFVHDLLGCLRACLPLYFGFSWFCVDTVLPRAWETEFRSAMCGVPVPLTVMFGESVRLFELQLCSKL